MSDKKIVDMKDQIVVHDTLGIKTITKSGETYSVPNLQEVEDAVTRLLHALKLNLDHEHLQSTPKRIAKMYVNELFSGLYTQPPKVTSFSDDSTYKDAIESATTNPSQDNQVVSGLVVSTGITVRSTCAHHFVPFLGKALVAYIPNKTVAGLSKFARVVDYFARRPQIQERLTSQVVSYLFEQLKPYFLFCGIKCTHQCMICRGVKENNSAMITYDFRISSDASIMAPDQLLTMLTKQTFDL